MKKVIIIIISILAIAGAAVGGYLLFNKKDAEPQLTDAQKFKEEYKGINKNNRFVFRSLNQINNILEKGTGVVYLGFPECPWCQQYVSFIEEAAEQAGVKEIYYNNILKDREDNTQAYKKTVSILNDYLMIDEEGNKRIFVPEIVIVKDGKILGHDNESSVVTKEDGTPAEYWTKEKVRKLNKKLVGLMNQVKTNSCTDCNK